MSLEEVQNNAISLYNKNIEYLKEKESELYNKLLLLEEAINSGLKEERYILEYKDSYFDIYDSIEEKWIYNEDSIKYSQKLVNEINDNPKSNSFKTFYEFEYEEGVVEKLEKASILSSAVYGNAPIADYIASNSSTEHKLKNFYCFMVLGVGLGLHIPFADKLLNSKLYFIVEPSLEIFRLSLFVTDYKALSQKTLLKLFIGLNKDEFYEKFRTLVEKTYFYNQYLKFTYFSKSCDIYIPSIQNVFTSQSHLLYSYDRELLSLSRTYEYYNEKYNFLNVSKQQQILSLENKPVLLIAAGPSFKKNIEFVKKNQNKFVIVTLWYLLPLLKEEGIIPDIVTNYDEEKRFCMESFEKLGNLDFLKNTIFIFSSHLYQPFINKLPKNQIYLFNALFSAKKDYGRIVAPSIGEITYELLIRLGVKNIYLLGLDMALDPDTGLSHSDGYVDNATQSKAEDSDNTSFSLRKNKFKVKGNLREEIETIGLFHISITQINIITKKAKEAIPDLSVYNLSDGAFFNGIEPLRIENMNMSEFKLLNKKDFDISLHKELSDVSSNESTEEDELYNKEKIEDALSLKELLDSHLSKKYSNQNEFMKLIEQVHINIHNPELKCTDLVKTLSNYCRHNLPYIVYFFNLKNIDNPKRHIKKLNKILNNQLNKIIKFYLKTLEGK